MEWSSLCDIALSIMVRQHRPRILAKMKASPTCLLWLQPIFHKPNQATLVKIDPSPWLGVSMQSLGLLDGFGAYWGCCGFASWVGCCDSCTARYSVGIDGIVQTHSQIGLLLYILLGSRYGPCQSSLALCTEF